MSGTDPLPRAHGAPVLRARMRSAPEDFVVEELPGFEPSGSGEHLLLTVEKRGMNTAFAAKRIAQWAGVGEMAIGYAGLKDRQALTRQRFSVHLPKRVAPDPATLDSVSESGESLRVLASTWHAKKLPRGALAGNRFVLTLREAQGERAQVEQRLQAIAARGVPNYFGEQRFGRDGDNVAAALAMFAGRRVRREQRSLLLSAARSELFNRVLAARVADGNWDRALPGEVWMLDGSRSVFGPQPYDDTLAARLAAFDIHPSGPLWGRGQSRAQEQAAELEQAALAGDEAAALRAGLEQAGLNQERRALRLRPEGLSWRWLDDAEGAVLELSFALPAGAYATVVMSEIGDIASLVRP
ncbi:tRNA pseudouridine(13) synthase TruD [Lysobacter silvisoli]|uniref:tRNA pseudouridine synthase D n=1 Tax=Lysobacter silvisoli TaxID=2293254 RepID=A0A371K5F0_9GAMM|nr:tRNA pseudouridine(13) synthase TruD [Lysobacter silvisoli]RDZ29159.1 tRNA pseudouridine(13) synthase TruD [Lysobacter silvisoli]